MATRNDIERERIRRLSAWIKGKKIGPVRIDIEPTNSCNLKCRFCWTMSGKRLSSCQYEKALSEKRILEVVHEAQKLGVLEWQIAGGWEPMVKRDLILRMAKTIKEYEMYGCITTNGTLFSDQIIKKLVQIGWDEILFSLEGPDAKTHDYSTQVKGSFKKSVWTMKRFNHWKKKFKTDKPKYSFHAVLTNKNYNKLSDMIILGHKVGCFGVNFEPLSVWSEKGKKLKLNERERNEVKKHAKKALSFAKKLQITTNAKNLFEPRLIKKDEMDEILKKDVKEEISILNSPCFEPWLSLEVRVSGRLAPCRLCDFDSDCDSIIEKSLEEIWFGEYFNNFRNQMMNKNMPPYCYTCAAGNVVNMKKMRKILMESVNHESA